MARVVMLLHKEVLHDSRVRREAAALAAAGHDVCVLELAAVDPARTRLDGFRRRSALPPAAVRRALPFHLYRAAYLVWFLRALLAERPAIVHAHDAAMLLPGWIGARLTGARLLYDSHELATGTAWRSRAWARFVATLERLLVPRAGAVVTVSDGIARRLQERYGLAERPVVVRNLPVVADRAAPGLRARAGLDGQRIVLHNGSIARGRGAEGLVRAVAQLPADVHLVLLGAAADPNLPAVRAAAREAGVAERVHALPAVAPEDVVPASRGADVGVSLLDDSCENHRLALPNKVFEYLAAEVPVVVSRLPELAGLVERLGVGWTAPPGDDRALAAALRAALERGEDPGLRARLRDAAARLRWEHEAPRLVAAYERLSRPSR